VAQNVPFLKALYKSHNSLRKDAIKVANENEESATQRSGDR
jgi:hypothetical protein